MLHSLRTSLPTLAAAKRLTVFGAKGVEHTPEKGSFFPLHVAGSSSIVTHKSNEKLTPCPLQFEPPDIYDGLGLDDGVADVLPQRQHSRTAKFYVATLPDLKITLLLCS